MKNKLLLIALLVPMNAISSNQGDNNSLKGLLAAALYLPTIYFGSKLASNFSETYKQVANGEADVTPEQMSECQKVEKRFRSLFPKQSQNPSICARVQTNFDNTSKNVPFKCERTAHKALLVMTGLGPQEQIEKNINAMKNRIKEEYGIDV